MKSMKFLARGVLLLLMPLYILTLAGCGGRSQAMQSMDLAEELMPLRPDSSLAVLDAISPESLRGAEEEARYALLKSIAFDKNYIDTTSLDVIQPAVDYYLKHGSADEKLRTCHYQGLIYVHRGELDMAMQTFLKGEAIGRNATDSLTLALLYVAKGMVNYRSYQIKEFVSNDLKASKILHQIDDTNRELQCLIKVLNGAITLKDKNLADSVLKVAVGLHERTGAHKELLEEYIFEYKVVLCDTATARKALESVTDFSGLLKDTQLDLCYGYMRLNEPRKAKEILDCIDLTSESSDSLRYIRLRYEILESNGEYREALEAYKTYFNLTDKAMDEFCSRKSTVGEEQYLIEIGNLKALRHREKLIWLSLSAVILLLLVSVIIFYKMQYVKADRRRLMLEKDNMAHQVAHLENEQARLTALLEQKDLSRPLVAIVKERLSMLNHLLAAHISGNSGHAKHYDKWLKENTKNSAKFISSVREAISAVNPRFLPWLADKGLTDTETDYICLGSLGLKSNEIGAYLNIKSHYYVSFNIRKKLGLSDTNLAPYIRKLLDEL
ncbi:MAG: hypothetical protein K2H94_09415 [Duncaniella sp.]|nr:hypothetical protein [Duncaniella sp.]